MRKLAEWHEWQMAKRDLNQVEKVLLEGGEYGSSHLKCWVSGNVDRLWQPPTSTDLQWYNQCISPPRVVRGDGKGILCKCFVGETDIVFYLFYFFTGVHLSAPKWKTSCTQQELLFQVSNEKKLLLDCASFVFLIFGTDGQWELNS